VVLIGASGSGKSIFARAHFLQTTGLWMSAHGCKTLEVHDL